MQNSVTYTMNKASAAEVVEHLQKCDDAFLQQLSDKGSVVLYSEKLVSLAICIEAWKQEVLIGFLAVYCNQPGLAFISNITLVPEAQGHGVAKDLMKRCITYVASHKARLLKLKVNRRNLRAIRFYQKFQFDVVEESEMEFCMQLKLDDFKTPSE